MSSTQPIVLSIAGSDCSAGAGLQGDLRTIESCGARAATVVTAITVQTGRGVHEVHALGESLVRSQLAAVLADLPVAAVKTGMLASAGVVGAVAQALLARPTIPLVVDPVLASSDGVPLLDADAVPVLVERLIPRATVVTPNAPEASRLTGIDVTDAASAARAGEVLLEMGAAAVVVTGGHFAGRDRGTDVLVTAAGVRHFSGPLHDTPHTRGSGCAFAAAVAVGLAEGRPAAEAVDRAHALLRGAIGRARAVGAGRGPVEPRGCLL